MNENRIFEALTELKVHASVTNERLKHYNESLDEHIKRTELLEKDMQVAMLPIKAAKILAAVSAGAVSVLTALKLLGKL